MVTRGEYVAATLTVVVLGLMMLLVVVAARGCEDALQEERLYRKEKRRLELKILRERAGEGPEAEASDDD